MLGKKIYELRKELNISQEELAMAINISRQSVSKWELGDSYPEVNKLKDIASFFNVSIDYLLDYEVEKTSCKEFIGTLKEAINNKVFSITINEIKSYILRFNNNFHLYIYSANYLFALELEKNERNLLELIIDYCKKAISLFNYQSAGDVLLSDIHSFVIKVYLVYKKYDLAMEYMKENKIFDKGAIAECNYRLKKYKDSSNVISNIYVSAITDIISSAHLQIRILLKQKNVKEALELTNWILNLIDSIEKIDGTFSEEKILYMYMKVICEKVFKIKSDDTIKELNILINFGENDMSNSEGIKFYYGEQHAFYTDFKAYKERLKEEILEDKDEYFELYSEVFKEVFGGDIDE